MTNLINIDHAPSEYEPNNNETKENNMNTNEQMHTPYGMLPTELAKQLRKAYTAKDAVKAVLNNSPLDTNEIMVEIYKNLNVVIKRASVIASLHKMKKSGEAVSAGRGLYVRGKK